MKVTHKKVQDINAMLEKMVELEKSKNKVNVYKVILIIAGSIAGILTLITLLCIMYNKNLSMESILSFLLAFFSIFISVLFYFKADDASKHFYSMSYDFMKDVSVTLGKIEERFGEKLNSLNEKVTNLSLEKEETTEELETVENEKNKMIEELLDKAKIDKAEKDNYARRLRQKEIEAESLRRQLVNIDKKYNTLIEKENDKTIPPLNWIISMLSEFSMGQLRLIRSKHYSDLPESIKRKMVGMGLSTTEGDLTDAGNLFYNIVMN